MSNEIDKKDAQLSELRRLLKKLLSAYMDASRLDMYYDLAQDTLAEQVQRVLSGESDALSEEFRLSRNVCKRALRFSRSIENDEENMEDLAKLFEVLEKWEGHMKRTGYKL